MSVIINDLEVMLEPPAPTRDGTEPAVAAPEMRPRPVRPLEFDRLLRQRLERLARVRAD